MYRLRERDYVGVAWRTQPMHAAKRKSKQTKTLITFPMKAVGDKLKSQFGFGARFWVSLV